jgi:hypothetical protein
VDVREWYDDLTYREAHLAMEGGFDGFLHQDPRFSKSVQGRVVGDSWYYKGGYVLGWVVKALLLLALALAGVRMGALPDFTGWLPSVPVTV